LSFTSQSLDFRGEALGAVTTGVARVGAVLILGLIVLRWLRIGIRNDNLILTTSDQNKKESSAPAPSACSFPVATSRGKGAMPQFVQGWMRSASACFSASEIVGGDLFGRFDGVRRHVDRADQQALVGQQSRSARLARANWRIRARPPRSKRRSERERSAHIASIRRPASSFHFTLASMP
jgi:hypothetical protein